MIAADQNGLAARNDMQPDRLDVQLGRRRSLECGCGLCLKGILKRVGRFLTIA